MSVGREEKDIVVTCTSVTRVLYQVYTKTFEVFPISEAYAKITSYNQAVSVMCLGGNL